jgi:hypothetical protein
MTAAKLGLNPVKEFLVSSISEQHATQRLHDEHRFTILHEREVMSRRKQWINELEIRVSDARSELLARTGQIGINNSRTKIRCSKTKPNALVSKIKINKNFKIDPSGPYATHEAASKLWNFMKDEKVKIFHTMPRSENHSIRHSLEEAEAPARRIIVVSPKDRASIMKKNAIKNINMRDRIAHDRGWNETVSKDREQESFHLSMSTGLTNLDTSVTKQGLLESTEESHHVLIQGKPLKEITKDTIKFAEDLGSTKSLLSINLVDRKKLHGRLTEYGYEQTFSDLKKHSTNIREIADNVIKDHQMNNDMTVKETSEEVAKARKGFVENGCNVARASIGGGSSPEGFKNRRGDDEAFETFERLVTDLEHMNEVDEVDHDMWQSRQYSKRQAHRINELRNMRDLVNEVSKDAPASSASLEVGTSTTTRSYNVAIQAATPRQSTRARSPSPPSVRPLSPPSTVKMAQIMGSVLQEDMREFHKFNNRGDSSEQYRKQSDGGSSKLESLQYRDEPESQQEISNENSSGNDNVEDAMPQHAEEEDELNSSSLSVGTAGLEDAAASISAVVDAAGKISPMVETAQSVTFTKLVVPFELGEDRNASSDKKELKVVGLIGETVEYANINNVGALEEKILREHEELKRLGIF